MSDWGFETRQIHAGAAPDPTTGARAVADLPDDELRLPRHRARGERCSALAELGNIYTRIMNPTQAVFEERVTALEGGVGALATASGQAAETIALLNLAENGGHIVASASLYGGTYNLSHYTFPKLGIEVTFIDDPDDLDAWRRRSGRTRGRSTARRSATRRATSSTSKASPRSRTTTGIPLVIDNTRRDARTSAGRSSYGADIVVHSATKFIGGHGTSIGGIIVDGGKFDYVASGRFANFTEPDPSYHGLVFSQLPEPLRPAQYILKARLQYQRDIGPAIAPFNSFLFLQGLETLSLRMERHCAERAGGRGVARGARRGRVGVRTPGLAVEPVERPGEEVPAHAARARSSRSGSRAASRPAAASSTASSCSATSPTSATCAASRSTRRARRTRSSTEEEQVTTGVTPDLVRLCGRHRDARRHPRRPRGRLPRREGRVRRMTPASNVPRHRRVAPGRSGRAPPVRDRVRPRAARRSRPAGGSDTSTVAYETWGTLERRARRTRSSCCTRSPATVTPSGPAGPGHREAGWWDDIDRPGAPIDTDRFFVVCPNVLGGCQGTTGPASTDPATAARTDSRFPAITIRDQVVVEVALADELGIERWARGRRRLDGRHARARVGGRPPRAASRTRCHRVRRGGDRRADRAVLAADPGDQRRPAASRGGDYYDAAPGDGPCARAGARPRHRPGQLPHRSRVRRPLRPRAARATRTRSPAVATRSSRTSSTTATSSRGASTRTPTSCCQRAMNHHDVGRGRGGIAAALARSPPTSRSPASRRTASTRSACSTSSRRACPRNSGRRGHPVDLGHDGFLIETEAVGKVITRALAELDPTERRDGRLSRRRRGGLRRRGRA